MKKWISMIVLAFFMLTIIDLPVLAVEVQNGVALTEKTVQRLSTSATSGTCGDNLVWDFADGVLTISGTGDMESYPFSPREPESSGIPWYSLHEEVKHIKLSYGITSIGDAVFCNFSNLESVDLPETITSIGYNAFYSCSSLKEIIFPEGLKTIKDDAFAKCGALTEINIPDSVTSIGEGAFRSCLSVKTLDTGDGITNFNGFCFFNRNSDAPELNSTALEKVVIGDGITEIPESMFQGCTLLTDISLGNHVEKIGDWAFLRCTALENFTVPDSVTEIGRSAFHNCENLTNIKLGESVRSIGQEAFYNCTALEEIIIPDSVIDVGRAAFLHCPSVKNIVIGDGLSDLISFECNGGSKYPLLESIVFGNAIEQIPSGFCYGYDKLSNVILGANVTSIGADAFSGCTSLTNIEIPNSVTNIGRSAFKGCNSLASVAIPNSITQINPGTFEGCSSLTNVTLSNSITDIETGAFENCSSLTNVTIPNSVSYLGGSAFAGCSSLHSAVILSGETEIYPTAFSGCNNLTIYSYPGSNVEEYAKEQEIPFIDLTDGDLPGPSGTTTSIHINDGLVCELGKIINVTATAVYPVSVQERGISWSVGDNSILDIVELVSDGADGVGTVKVEGKKIGETTITATTKDGASFTQKIVVKSVDVEKKGFSAKTDGWNFANAFEAFGYPADYRMPETPYKEVFGGSYVAAAKTSNSTFDSMMPSWFGNCFGMSATAILFYQNKLDWNQYRELYSEYDDFYNVNDYRSDIQISPNGLYTVSDKNQVITNLIEQYVVLQSSSRISDFKKKNSTVAEVNSTEWCYEAKETGWINKKQKFTHNPNGSYIRTVLDKINHTTVPLMVDIQKGGIGHTMVIRNDREPQKMENGWYRVYIYDPNTPFLPEYIIEQYEEKPVSWYCNGASEDRYLELNPDKNQWRYVGSVTGDSPNRNAYWGSDKFDNVLYFTNSEGTVEQPHYMYVYSISNIGFPTSFNGTEPWLISFNEAEPWLKRWKDSVTIMTTPNSNFMLFDEKGNKICEVVNGYPFASVEGIEYTPFIGYLENRESGNGGRLTIPYSEFVVNYDGGDDISFLGDKSVINIAADKPITMLVSMNNDQIELSSENDNDVTVQITDVYDNENYTSVQASGILTDGDTVALQLSDDKLTVDNKISGDSKLDVYTDNVEKTDDQYITTLVAGKEDITIPDVRDLTADVPVDPTPSRPSDDDNTGNKPSSGDNTGDKPSSGDNTGDKPSSSGSGSYGGSSSGGFTGTYNYPVKADSTGDATVTFDKNNAVAGDKVTVTVKPNTGKAVDEVIATDADNKVLTVTKVGDNKYSFTMPSSAVKVAVTTKAATYDKRIVLQVGNRNVRINDTTFANDVAPVIVDNRTMVPIRVVTEALGGKADWNGATQTVTLTIEGNVLRMTIGQTIPGFDGAPVILNSRTYVPIRYVAEKLGATVEWIAETQQIIIEK